MKPREIAVAYIKSLNIIERNHLKTMLDHGIICGTDWAISHEIEPKQLTDELKKIFRGE